MGLIFTLSGITLLYGGVSVYKKSRQLGYSSCGHIPSRDVDVDEPEPVAVASLTLTPEPIAMPKPEPEPVAKPAPKPEPEPVAYLQTLSSLFRDVKYD